MDGDLSSTTLAAEVRERIDAWDSVMGDWIEEAVNSYAMVAGDQWTEADMEAMKDRPAVTMNRLAAMVRGVCGLEVSQRMEARYLARDMGDVQAVEIHNAAARWVREGCNAEDEESDAFRDMLTCGLGWTETRVDFDVDPEGAIVVERIDPLLMRWDASAVKRGLADTRWRARLKPMDIEEVYRLWPERKDEIVANMETDEVGAALHAIRVGDAYRKGEAKGGKIQKDEVTLVQYQWFDSAYFVKVMDTVTGKPIDVEEERFAALSKMGMPGVVLRRFKKRVYRQVIMCGTVVLEEADLGTTGFTLNCMTGARDRNKGTWYGLVRDLVDPQRWSNKFFSTVIDTLATNAKGGMMAETTSVDDPRKFEENWSDPRATVWLKPGGLNKLAPRPSPSIPPQMGQVMEFAVGSMPQISGINLEFMGMADRNQPGILEYHRKQAVASSLAEFFASLRQYRKTQGVVLLEMIYEYIADGRLIRIVGQQGEQYVPLMRQAEVKYDVVVDEAATAPDRKMQAWLALTELLPMAMQAGLPVPPSVLDYSPLPQSLAMEWKQMITEQPRIPPEAQKQLEEMQKQVQKLQQENMQLKDKRQEAQAEMQIDQQKMQADLQLETARVQAEIQLEREKAMAEIQLEREKANIQLTLQREKAMLDASVKEQLGLANVDAKYTFSKEGNKITGVTDHTGAQFLVERDEAGKLIGLRAATKQ